MFLGEVVPVGKPEYAKAGTRCKRCAARCCVNPVASVHSLKKKSKKNIHEVYIKDRSGLRFTSFLGRKHTRSVVTSPKLA